MENIMYSLQISDAVIILILFHSPENVDKGREAAALKGSTCYS